MIDHQILTRGVLLLEYELFTTPEHQRSPLCFLWVRVAQLLAFV
jgi:hypothetical protein